MASHSAFKIRVTYEAYINFFATIHTGASPERLAGEVRTELEFPRDALESDLTLHPQPSGPARGRNMKSNWSIFYRQPPAGLPACDVPSEKL
jgi:hypothetical protein